MREVVEFRVDEDFAPLLCSDNEGKRLGDSVRKVQVDTADSRFAEIGRLQKEMRATRGRPFFFGWNIQRKYTPTELAAAKLFHLSISAVFEPTGEECGTEYDESAACAKCGSGARQVGALATDLRCIPKGKDLIKTIAGEILISERFAAILRKQGIRGAKFELIKPVVRTKRESRQWFQLVIGNASAEITHPTRTGIDPFDPDEGGTYRCQCGDLIGLNLLSELTVLAETAVNSDFLSTRQFIGLREGFLRPERAILISSDLANLLRIERVKGAELEIVHLT